MIRDAEYDQRSRIGGIGCGMVVGAGDNIGHFILVAKVVVTTRLINANVVPAPWVEVTTTISDKYPTVKQIEAIASRARSWLHRCLVVVVVEGVEVVIHHVSLICEAS